MLKMGNKTHGTYILTFKNFFTFTGGLHCPYFLRSLIFKPVNIENVHHCLISYNCCWIYVKDLFNVYVLDLLSSSSPSAAYMHQWTVSALVQVMTCRLFGAKPLPELMLIYCQLDSWEQISVKLGLEFSNFHSRKCIWKCCLPKWGPFCPGGDELKVWRDQSMFDRLSWKASFYIKWYGSGHEGAAVLSPGFAIIW